MVRITFVEPGGSQKQVEVQPGTCLMRAAIDNDIAGMMADCGGELSCATCHTYIDTAYLAAVGGPSAAEAEMLECAAAEVRPNSRLACQLIITEAFEGMTVEMPDRQT